MTSEHMRSNAMYHGPTSIGNVSGYISGQSVGNVSGYIGGQSVGNVSGYINGTVRSVHIVLGVYTYERDVSTHERVMYT